MIIRDPRTQDGAFVESGRLRTDSKTVPEGHEASHGGDAYAIGNQVTARTLTTTATGGAILYLKNDESEKEMVVSHVDITSNTAGVVIEVVINPTKGTLANNSTGTKTNLNTGSNKTAETEFEVWDEVGDGITGLSGGSSIGTWQTGTGCTRILASQMLLVAPGGSFQVNAHGAAEVSYNIHVYFQATE